MDVWFQLFMELGTTHFPDLNLQDLFVLGFIIVCNTSWQMLIGKDFYRADTARVKFVLDMLIMIIGYITLSIKPKPTK